MFKCVLHWFTFFKITPKIKVKNIYGQIFKKN